MNSGINVNYMTKAFTGYVQSCEAKHRTGQSGSFRSAAERIAESARKASPEEGSAAKAGGIDMTDVSETERAFDVRDMTMEEYKQYIYDKISRISIDPSQTGWQWHIDITEAGFEAMKNDPEYEESVLRSIRANFSFHDPFGSRTFAMLHFGASEAENHGEVMSYDNPAIPKEKEKSFWERRMERSRMFQKQFEELQEKRALARKWGLPEPGNLDIGALLAMLCESASGK